MGGILPELTFALARLKRNAGLILLVLAACRNPNRTGEVLFPPPTVRTDTLFVRQIRQIFLPPPSSRNAPFVFLGTTTDSLIGRWEGSWATQFALGGTNVRFYTNELIGVDSVILELFLAGVYGNFGKPMQVRVFRLTQPLSSAQEYTTESVFIHDGQNLCLPGKDSLFFTAFTPRSHRLPLSPALGEYLLRLPPEALTGQAAFQAAFPGLYVEASPFEAQASGAIYTIFPRSIGTVLRVYYRERLQGQEVPQRYDFFISDTCVWAYRLVRHRLNPPTLRDMLESDSAQWQQKLLIAGGLPVGLECQIQDWEKLRRRPIISAYLRWASDSAAYATYSPFYPRPSSLALYADTSGEVATASWGFSEWEGTTLTWELSRPVQEISLGRRAPPQRFYLWVTGRNYTLQRWVGSGTTKPQRPYLIVTSADP
ncbi:MAG: DUF4270 family protein [Bacteroidia bacterium]